MKKIIAVLLAAVMIFAFAACAGNKTNEKETSESTSDAASNAKADVKVATDGILLMATNASFPPYEYKEGESFAGIDVEIAGLIAKKLGLELKIEDVDFGSIVGGVQTGKFDMGMAGMTVTEERQQSVNFSTSYAHAKQVIIVAEGSSIASVDDLKDDGSVTIGVQQDTTGDIYASDDYGQKNVTRYKTGNDAVLALAAGKVDCVIIDNEPAKAFVKANDGLKILDTEYVEEDYAIAINKDNSSLLDAVNIALAELKEAGELDKIIEKYIPAE